MELKADLEFMQLLQIVRKLPEDKRSQLKAELSSAQSLDEAKSIESFQELLLRGPVMDDDQYKAYKETRNHFNKWRTK
ncbi:MAG TPA: hypothetical protein VGN20_15105 [Mucilaginibacter sp.]|jgi:hypothetical protein